MWSLSEGGFNIGMTKESLAQSYSISCNGNTMVRVLK